MPSVSRMGGEMWEEENAYRILVRKPEGRDHMGFAKFGFEDNIKVCLQLVGWEGRCGKKKMPTGFW